VSDHVSLICVACRPIRSGLATVFMPIDTLMFDSQQVLLFINFESQAE